MGIANVIPGLSGGTMMVITKKYSKCVNIFGNLISNIKNKNKEQLKADFAFLVPFLLGVIVGVLFFAKLLNFLINDYIVATSFSFMGLIIGTLPMLFVEANSKEKAKLSSYLSLIITLALSLVLAYFKIFKGDTFRQLENISINFSNILLLLLFGFVAAGTMVIPGISGSLVLMLIGGYKVILSAVASILDFTIIKQNLFILIPFGIGIVIGFFLFSYLINKLIGKYYTQTYYGILGFCIGSIPCLFPSFTFNTEGYIAIALLVVFAFISWFITKKAKNTSI